MDDTISRRGTVKAIRDAMLAWSYMAQWREDKIVDAVKALPSAQPEIAENLYLYKCFITDKDGLQHEVIHTGDIRRVTGWEI